MNQTKTLVINKKAIIFSAIQFVVLMGIAITTPLIKQQLLSGSIVNAVLFISVALFGIQNAILVGLIPSLVALSSGLLPAVLAPMIPFIIAGNTILVLVFGYLRKKNYWLGMVSAGFFKFIFLLVTSSIVFDLITKKEIASKVALMMSWPQLFTAILGGLIAYFVLKITKKNA